MCRKTHFFTLAAVACLLICSGISNSLLGQTPASPPAAARDARPAGERMVLTINNVEYAFRWCPPGTFTMGCSEMVQAVGRDMGIDIGVVWPEKKEEIQRTYRPHRVTLSRGFWMLETPVTQAMWESVMGNNPSYFRGANLQIPVESARLPVERVSWNEAQQFIQRLNERLAGTPRAPAGFRFSLPTEAQWEYACRAGTTTAFHFGDTLTSEQASFDLSIMVQEERGLLFARPQTSEVGRFPANAWGLRDMHGNVYEWVQDWIDDYPSGAVTDPTGPTQGVERVIRGGAFSSVATHCRSAYRYWRFPLHGDAFIGFRLALVSEN